MLNNHLDAFLGQLVNFEGNPALRPVLQGIEFAEGVKAFAKDFTTTNLDHVEWVVVCVKGSGSVIAYPKVNYPITICNQKTLAAALDVSPIIAGVIFTLIFCKQGFDSDFSKNPKICTALADNYHCLQGKFNLIADSALYPNQTLKNHGDAVFEYIQAFDGMPEHERQTIENMAKQVHALT